MSGHQEPSAMTEVNEPRSDSGSNGAMDRALYGGGS